MYVGMVPTLAGCKNPVYADFNAAKAENPPRKGDL
jgi:hypothetical protein